MQIHLTPEQEEFVRQGVASGRFKNAEEAVEEAFDLCEEREHDREDDHAEEPEGLLDSAGNWVLAAAAVVAMLALTKAKF
jgi:putative addiction module CopG family antidote